MLPIERLRTQLARAEAKGDLAAAVMLRARIAADEPKYAATDEAQDALAQAAELAKIARRKADQWSEAELREAWGR